MGGEEQEIEREKKKDRCIPSDGWDRWSDGTVQAGQKYQACRCTASLMMAGAIWPVWSDL